MRSWKNAHRTSASSHAAREPDSDPWMIEYLQLQTYRLPLVQPWRTSDARLATRRGWLVRLDSQGKSGYGDCAPLAQAGTGSHAESQRWWQGHLKHLQGRESGDILADHKLLREAPPAAACALECALLDVQAQLQQRTLRALLDARPLDTLPVNATIGALDSESSTRAHAAEQAGFQVLKLKVGMQPPAETLHQLRRLAAGLAPGTRLRLDANQAWSGVAAVQRFLQALAAFPVEYVEEPLRAPTLKALQRLQQDSPVSIALDESLACLPHDEVLEGLPGACLILKPMALGGLRPCLRLARKASHHAMRVICTSVVESAAGIWNTAQLAACLGSNGEIPAQGLATSAWLAQDLGQAPPIRNGLLQLGQQAGSGFVAYAREPAKQHPHRLQGATKHP